MCGEWGGAHDQQVRVHGLFGQHAALPHAEAVLLVDDGQPQPGKLHPSLRMAWVPTMRSASSPRMAASVVRFAAAFMPPVSRATRMPKGANIRFRPSACCAARISVGASRAA